MSIRVDDFIEWRDDLTNGEYRVARILSDHCHGDHVACWPGLDRLHRKAGKTKWTVQLRLAGLAAKNVITVEPGRPGRPRKGTTWDDGDLTGGRSTRYTFTFENAAGDPWPDPRNPKRKVTPAGPFPDDEKGHANAKRKVTPAGLERLEKGAATFSPLDSARSEKVPEKPNHRRDEENGKTLSDAEMFAWAVHAQLHETDDPDGINLWVEGRCPWCEARTITITSIPEQDWCQVRCDNEEPGGCGHGTQHGFADITNKIREAMNTPDER